MKTHLKIFIILFIITSGYQAAVGQNIYSGTVDFPHLSEKYQKNVKIIQIFFKLNIYLFS